MGKSKITVKPKGNKGGEILVPQEDDTSVRYVTRAIVRSLKDALLDLGEQKEEIYAEARARIISNGGDPDTGILSRDENSRLLELMFDEMSLVTEPAANPDLQPLGDVFRDRWAEELDTEAELEELAAEVRKNAGKQSAS